MTRRTWLTLVTLSVLLYAALAALYPLTQGLPNPRWMWAQQADAAPHIGLAHIALYGALFTTYAFALKHVHSFGQHVLVDGRLSPKTFMLFVIGGWVLFSLVLLFSFPGESADIFDYIFRGRMLANYGLSPLSVTPFEVKDLPFHRYVSWTKWVDAYGPLWEYASAVVAWSVMLFATSAENLVRINQTCAIQPEVCTLLAKYVIGYRLFAIGLTGVCGGLIYAIVNRQSSNVTLAGAALVVWLWNPLVVISTAVGAHNDVVMLAFALLSIWLALRDRWVLALFALFAAAHVKFTALVFLPVLCLWMAHRLSWARAVGNTLMSIAIALPISFALYAPLGGWATLPRNFYERSLLSTNSLGELLYLFLRETAGWQRFSAQQVAGRASLIVFLIVGGYALSVAWRRRTYASSYWLRVGIITIVAYLALGSFWFQAWYLVWPVALVALLATAPLSRLRRGVVAYCVGAMLASVSTDYLRAAAALSNSLISTIGVGLVYTPLIVVVILMWMWVHRRAHLPFHTSTSTPSQTSQ
jgi:hypothetical protein